MRLYTVNKRMFITQYYWAVVCLIMLIVVSVVLDALGM